MIVFGSSIITISRRFMSTISDLPYHLTHDTWIVIPGQLVVVKRNCLEQRGEYGIIIECVCPDFGIGYDDEYLVLVNGKPQRLRTFMIYPVGETL